MTNTPNKATQTLLIKNPIKFCKSEGEIKDIAG